MQQIFSKEDQPYPWNQLRTDCGLDEPFNCRIKRKVIEKVCLKRSIKSYKNMPKNIVGSFRKLLP